MTVTKARNTKKSNTNDQAITAPAPVSELKEILESEIAAQDGQDQDPVPTGLAGSRGELYHFPVTNDYCCQPYNALEAIPATVFDLVKANFQPISNVKKQALAKAQKTIDLKPTKYVAQFVLTYEFESLDDLNNTTFSTCGELEAFLEERNIEYLQTKTDSINIKALRGQRSCGTTGTTMGGLSDPFNRPDISVPIASPKSVKRGSSAHLALLAALEHGGVSVRDHDPETIKKLNEIKTKYPEISFEDVNPSAFNYKFKQVIVKAGYGLKHTGNRRYQAIAPQGWEVTTH